MSKRPVAVTVVACLFIATGVLGLAFHLQELVSERLFRLQELWSLALSIVAAASGIFLLFGHEWARWLALAWMAFHVAISFLDSLQKVAVHVLLFVLIGYALFRADSTTYFHRSDEAGG